MIDDFGGRSRDSFFDDFFNRSFGSFGFGKPVSLNTKEIPVTVLGLPARGRPANFSGLVGGGLELSVQTDKNVAQVGEPINLTLEIRGEGNFKTMSAPEFVQPDGFKMYESGTTSDLYKKENIVSGRKKYEYVLVPQLEGEKTLPPVTLSYFDPAERTYKTIQSAPIHLEIKPGTAEEGRRVVIAGSGEDIEVLGKDINYIHPVPAVIRPSAGSTGLGAWYVALHALPLLAVLGSILIERRRKRLRGDVRLARASRAAREAEKKLGEARRLLTQGQPAEVYPMVSDAVRGYIADKMNASVSGLTGDEIEKFLAGKGAADEDLEKLRVILKICDSAQYSPVGSEGPGGRSTREMIELAAEAVRIFDKRYLS
jgi:hypothetical protein